MPFSFLTTKTQQIQRRYWNSEGEDCEARSRSWINILDRLNRPQNFTHATYYVLLYLSWSTLHYFLLTVIPLYPMDPCNVFLSRTSHTHSIILVSNSDGFLVDSFQVFKRWLPRPSPKWSDCCGSPKEKRISIWSTQVQAWLDPSLALLLLSSSSPPLSTFQTWASKENQARKALAGPTLPLVRSFSTSTWCWADSESRWNNEHGAYMSSIIYRPLADQPATSRPIY